MKELKIFAMLIIAMMAMTGCKDDDDPKPASEEMMHEVTGHWLAKIPISGEISNWRSEEGEMTIYDNIDALIYLNGWVTTNKGSFWGYVYMKDGEMVNYDGIDRSGADYSGFDIAMDSDGNITPSVSVGNVPKVTNMRYAGNVITADVNYLGRTISLVFHRPTEEEEARLNEVFEMLLEAGIIGGYEDDDDRQKTDVTDKSATEPSRAKRTWRGIY